jgi:hypothetical protein
MSQKIGIIYSPGYGAGWSTWGDSRSALDQELALAINSGKSFPVLCEIAERNWPDQYTGGLHDAKVLWVTDGTAFRVEEYDGWEGVTLVDDMMIATLEGGDGET